MIAATTATWVFILIPLIAIWLCGIVDIVRRDLGRGTKAAWILIVVLLPVLGTILYFSHAGRQALARDTNDSGNHVVVEVHTSATLTLD